MKTIPESGQRASDVLADLETYGANDLEWRDGKMFAYVFHANDEVTAVAEKAYKMYMWENALDPTVFPSLLRFETEVVSMAAAHLRGDDQVTGNFTSGGTESVLLAVKTARDWARANKPGLGRPQMILPVTAHPCFHKAAQYFELDTLVVPVDPNTFKADAGAMREAITENTVLLVGSATSYAHGVVDPIPEIAKLALDNNILCHVDGCIGGFMLPLFRELGADVTEFDFTVPGVTSISMDLHKYAFTPKGASVVLYRNAEIRRHQIFTYSGWPGYSMVNPTIQSSKSGGPVAAAWAVMRFIGRDGYLKVAQGLKHTVEKIVAGIGAMDDFRILGTPEMSLVAVGSDTVDLFALCDAMGKLGWTMHPQMKFGELCESFHLTVVPGNVARIEEWLRDLAACTAALRNQTEATESGLRQAIASIDLERLTDTQIEQLLEMAGLGGGALPGGEMAEINHILNDLTPEITDRLLSAYFNQLSRYRDPGDAQQNP